MADKGEDEKGTTNKVNSKKSGKLDYGALYEQISKENPILEANKSFWLRKGNSQKYTCILCNIGIQVSPKLSVFKSAILAHVEDKYHKKRFDNFSSKESVVDSPIGTLNINTEHEDQNVNIVKGNRTNVHTLENKVKGLKENDCGKWYENNICPVDLDSIYKSFENEDPVVKMSKKFISKTENGRNFNCELCKSLIPNSQDATECKYNLWVHINEDIHKNKLPNFTLVSEQDFEKVMMDLSKALPACYKNEERFFEIGPVFRFVKCSICDEAVSINMHRLENHVRTTRHTRKKNSVMKGEALETEPVNYRIRHKFKKLVRELDGEFEKDVKFIKTGKLPGYIVCSLCPKIVLPTKFYLQTHLESAMHEKNKSVLLTSDNK